MIGMSDHMKRVSTMAISPRAATIILPADSNSAVLQAAISSAASGDIIELSSDMDVIGVVTIPAGRSITIQSTAGTLWTMTATDLSYRHFLVYGELILHDLIVSGGITASDITSKGGIEIRTGGVLTMTDGSVVTSCVNINGGGIYVNVGATFHLDGGAVRDNTAAIPLNFACFGGGIYNGGTFPISGTSEITGNQSINRSAQGLAFGGGVFNTGNVQMTGGTIGSNRAVGSIDISSGDYGYAYGGGVSNSGTFLMEGGAITGNFAMGNTGNQVNSSYGYGGGVYNDGEFIMRGTARIDGNTITGDSSNTTSIFYAYGGGVCSISMFIMEGGEISGNTAYTDSVIAIYNAFGGGVYAEGIFTISGGSITGNTINFALNADANYLRGGGIALLNSADLTMSGGAISGNAISVRATPGVMVEVNYGGGVYVDNSTFRMENGTITNNTANYGVGYGGGVYIYVPGTMIMDGGGSVRGNTADYGGGIYDAGTTNITGGTIGGNTAAVSGGGAYVTDAATFTADGATSIVDNSAIGGDGGGIDTQSTTYSNLFTAADTIFSGNTASLAYTPPADAALIYPNIGFASTSISFHPLNNYDINFTGGEVLTVTVTYLANGGTGGPYTQEFPYDMAGTLLSPEATGISRAGYIFVGWNTEPDGSGTYYEPGDTVVLTQGLTLYAQWTPTEGPYDVVYDANGGTGSYADTGIPGGTMYTVRAPDAIGITRPGYTFIGWNTRPDGSGTEYQPGESTVIAGDLILYAQWTPEQSNICWYCVCSPCSCFVCNPPRGNRVW